MAVYWMDQMKREKRQRTQQVNKRIGPYIVHGKTEWNSGVPSHAPNCFFFFFWYLSILCVHEKDPKPMDVDSALQQQFGDLHFTILFFHFGYSHKIYLVSLNRNTRYFTFKLFLFSFCISTCDL